MANQLKLRVSGAIAANRKKRGATIAFAGVSPGQARQIAERVGELAEIA